MIRYREGALRDIAEAAGWYRRRRPAYEGRFFERLRETVRRIEGAPLNCAIAMEAEGVRKARVKRVLCCRRLESALRVKSSRSTLVHSGWNRRPTKVGAFARCRRLHA
jgi:hypothetical protein